MDFTNATPMCVKPECLPCVDLAQSHDLRCELSNAVRAGMMRVQAPEEFVTDWKFAQKNPTEELAQLYTFSFKKCHGSGNTEFIITVREYAAPPPGQHVHFFAQADKYVNQKIAPFIPTGWGKSLLDALSDCTRMIREFPCDQEQSQLTSSAAPAAPGA
jgi:hypothetical protein